MSRWLVTGGAGYIGAHIVRKLLETDREVVVLDNLLTGYREFVAPGARFVDGSIGDAAAVDASLDGVDGVVHVAALKYAGESVKEPLRFYENNVEGMRVLLERVVAAGIEPFVYSSSCSVYGTPTDVPVVESTAWAPESPYGETKLIGEWLVRDVARVAPLRHTSLRYFNPVGSAYDDIQDRSPFNLVPLVFRAVQAGERPKVFGTDYDTPDGSCIRDYIHMGDLADAHVAAVAALEAGHPLAPAYNIGTGTGASVHEVLDAVERVLGVDLRREAADRRPGDPARIVGDPSLAARDLAWTTRLTLDDMVRDAWTAWQSSNWV
jgi:UDP-glucose 4-epimerase